MSAHPRGHRSHASGRRWMQRDSGRKKGRLVQHARSMEVKIVNGAREAECEECGGSGERRCDHGSYYNLLLCGECYGEPCELCRGTGRIPAGKEGA